MNRRRFLQFSAAATAAVQVPRSFAATPASASSGQRRRDMKKGFMLATLRSETADKLSVLAKFRLLRDAGFEGVEVLSAMSQSEVVAARDSTGLAIPYMGRRIEGFVETKIEEWLGLKINREKTRVFDAQLPGQTLDLLGYSLRFERDLYERNRRWWRLFPSQKTVQKQRRWLRDNINARYSFELLPEAMNRVNAHFRSWQTYFSLGNPRREYRKLNQHLQTRLTRHLQRRSQRAYRKPAEESWYAHLQKLGLVYL